MSVQYSLATINARLSAVVTQIDAGSTNGIISLMSGNTVISTVTLSKASGTVANGVLTFNSGTANAAVATGNVTTAKITDSAGNLVASGFTVGIPLSGADIILSNGANSTLVNSGATVSFLGATITGS